MEKPKVVTLCGSSKFVDIMTKQEAVQRSEAIPGWMHHLDLEWLYDQAAQCEKVVEVGCWKGKTTALLSAACPGIVYAVDTWRGGTGNDLAIGDVVFEEAYGAFLKTMRDCHCENVLPITMTSLQAAELLPDVDLVMIDADHSYEYVKADIAAWKPKTKFLLCGHDADWPSVLEAVIECIGPQAVIPGTSVWREFQNGRL